MLIFLVAYNALKLIIASSRSLVLSDRLEASFWLERSLFHQSLLNDYILGLDYS